MLAIEFCLVLVSLVIAFTLPSTSQRWFQAAECSFIKLARRRRLAVLGVGLAAVAGRAAVLPIEPVPQPAIHDEFSHLLLADTLAHGRLANPAHSMWVHFESFHIIQKPTYASMYYPGQAVFLAAGQVIAGHPFWGVWVSIGLMCAAICWMLQGWLPARWALLGGLLAVIRLAVFSYWGNSYYGGAVPAMGGALVLGALPRIKRRQRVGDALLMGLGLALLAASRPYESLFFCVPVGVALFAWMLGKGGPPLGLAMRRILLPVGLLVAATVAALGYYFWRVTGSPVRAPYQVDIQAYNLLYFPWERLKPWPAYHHSVMQHYYQGVVSDAYRAARSNPVPLELQKATAFWFFFLGPALTLPLLMLASIAPYGFSYRSIGTKTRFLLWVCFCSSIGLALPVHALLPHYAAPLTAPLYALILQAMRHLRIWRWSGKPVGLFLVRAVPSVCLTMLLLRLAAPLLGLSPLGEWPHTWYSPGMRNEDRARIFAQIRSRPGRHLLMVRYAPHHDYIREWVYNEADIDNAKVVWARDMGVAKNQELLDYFKDRHVWLVEPDRDPPVLSPYTDSDK